jgi:hypothetical protein
MMGSALVFSLLAKGLLVGTPSVGAGIEPASGAATIAHKTGAHLCGKIRGAPHPDAEASTRKI